MRSISSRDELLLGALLDTKELAFIDRSGESRRVPAAGYPSFPSCGARGMHAYVAITSAPDPWQVVIVVLDATFGVLDIVPGAAVFAPPVWSDDGSRLLFVQGDSAAGSAAIWHASDGHVEELFSRSGLRSAAWSPSGQIVFVEGASIYRMDCDTAERLASVPAAGGLLAYGSDDLYVTLDQLAIGPQGQVAAVERWSRQGMRSQEHIVELDRGELVRRGLGRYPQWQEDGRLLFTSHEGTPILSGCPAVSGGPTMHSICRHGHPGPKTLDMTTP